jgi:peptidoglycan/xylan/chitin deacetylase (PgdA/CDA1 family)
MKKTIRFAAITVVALAMFFAFAAAALFTRSMVKTPFTDLPGTAASADLLVWPASSDASQLLAPPDRESEGAVRSGAAGQPKNEVQEITDAVGDSIQELEEIPADDDPAGADMSDGRSTEMGQTLPDTAPVSPVFSGIPAAFVHPDQPTVYLTFDDGPSGLTEQVLDILQKEKVPATFFVLGNQAERWADTLKRIVEEGHAIGNHTYNHVYAELYSDFEVFRGQLIRTEKIIEQITGIRPQLVRAPGGTFQNFDDYYFQELERLGYIVHDWNVDSGDSRSRHVKAAEIVANVKNSKLRHELVVLMHDGGGHEETVKALPNIIRYYKNKGYVFASLTPEVEPTVFPVADTIKWDRKIIRTAKEPAKQKSRQAAANYKPLTIITGHGKVNIEADQVEMKDNRLYIPLRTLVQKMGGTIRWDAEKQEAVFRYGSLTGKYRASDGTLTMLDGSVKQEIRTASFVEVKGAIIVPLREALQYLGFQIGTYHEDEKSIEITLS